jgi:hypothetical protein
MSVLKNARHEIFAQQLIQGQKHGWTRGACYSRAGYKAEGKAAEVNASRLLSNANNGIVARVREIVGAGAARAAVTVESLLGELDMVLAGAVDDRQFGAARAAIDSKARLKGLFVDKVEIGQPGAFTAPTVAETLAMVAREFGPMTASAIAWTLDHDDAEMPVDDVARFTLAVITVDEALARLEQLRAALLKAASDGAVLVEAVPHDEPLRDSVDREALALLTRPKRKGRR